MSHLEIMVTCCGASDCAAIREFLQSRGFTVSASSHDGVQRLWAAPAQRRPVHLRREQPPRGAAWASR